MTITPITLIGERARLEPLAASHFDALWTAGQDPAIWTHFPAHPQTREEMAAYLTTLLADQQNGTSLPFTIIDQATERVVGSTRFLTISVAHRNAEIGSTWLTPEVWRTRINTECKYLLLRHGFEEWGMLRIQIKTDLRNERSQRAIARLGAVREGVLRRHSIMPDGYVRDTVMFSIIDEEWPAVKARLESFLR